MKILFVSGLPQANTSERLQKLIQTLGKRHHLVFLDPQANWTRRRLLLPLRFFERLQITRNLVREGKKQEGVDLVFCKDYMHALPGYFISRSLKKPCVWESEGSMKVLWETSHKYPQQVLPWMFVERWLAKRIDYMITVTEEDEQAYIRQGMDPRRIHVIPISIDPDIASRKTKEEARESLRLPGDKILFLFFSNFNYPPNRTALNFLNERVAPQLPGKLLLCGVGNVPRKLHPNIQHLGFLPLEKLYDLIRASDIGLAPIWEAKGTLTKVLDMLIHGLPAVVTSVVQRGIPELQDGVHAIIAKSREEFIQKTLDLAQDDVLLEKLGRAAPEVVLKKYNFHLYKERLLSLVESFSLLRYNSIP